MNRTVVGEWILRVVGYGISAVAGWVGLKYGPEIGACVGVAGAVVTNKAIPYIVPTASNVAASNLAPPPVKILRKGMPGS